MWSIKNGLFNYKRQVTYMTIYIKWCEQKKTKQNENFYMRKEHTNITD